MKKIYLFGLALMMSSVFQLPLQKLTGHTKPFKISVNKNILNCKINNKEWISTSVSGIKSEDIKKLTLSAGNTDKSGILINMPVDVKPGIYIIGKMGTPFTANYNPSLKIIYHSVSGTLNITSITNNHIIGTFSFNASSLKSLTDVIDITNGSFNVDINI